MLVAPRTTARFSDTSQLEFNHSPLDTDLACLLERELAEAEWDGKRIRTKQTPWGRYGRQGRFVLVAG